MPDMEKYEFDIRPAKRENVGLFVGLAGGTGSGKTYSALRLARGMVGPNGRILGADTEGRRMSHYTDYFKFDTVDIMPPYRPAKFAALVKLAEAEKYDVLIIDSFSHEHSGEGGTNDWHDEELDRAVVRAQQKAEHPEQVNEEAVRNANNFTAWIKPKTAHKAMVQSFLQRRIPIIFCLRAEEKIKVTGGGKPQPLGWMPIADKDFGYELTTMITLSNERPGRVDYSLPRKIQEQHLHLFPDGKPITEKAGEGLAAWARGDAKPETKPEEAKTKSTNGNGKPADRTTTIANELIARIKEQASQKDVEAIFNETLVSQRITWMKGHRNDQYTRIMKAADDRNAELAAVPATSPETPQQTPEA